MSKHIVCRNCAEAGEEYAVHPDNLIDLPGVGVVGSSTPRPCPIGGPDGKHDFDFAGGGYEYRQGELKLMACECGAMKCLACSEVFAIGAWIRGKEDHVCK